MKNLQQINTIRKAMSGFYSDIEVYKSIECTTEQQKAEVAEKIAKAQASIQKLSAFAAA